MLDFTKLPSGNFRALDYELLYNPLAKTWLVRKETTKIATGLKGFASAKEVAQEHFNNNQKTETTKIETTKKKETETMPTVKTRTTQAAKTVPAKIETPEPVKETPTKPQTRKVAAQGTKAKAVPAFPDFDKWAETNVTLLPVPKSGMKKAGIEAQNKKTLQGAKLKHGRERSNYNKANGLTAETPTKSVPKTGTKTAKIAVEKPVKSKVTAAEKHGQAFGGKAFHNFGPVPTELEYTLAQLDNARCSKFYNIVHSRKHPYSTAAKASYLANVERCFVAEKHVWETAQDANQPLPKNMYFEYFNAKGVPVELIREPKEGLSVLSAGHTIDGFGRLKESAGVKLPVTLGTRTIPAKK